MLTHQAAIESQFKKNLVDNLNAGGRGRGKGVGKGGGGRSGCAFGDTSQNSRAGIRAAGMHSVLCRLRRWAFSPNRYAARPPNVPLHLRRHVPRVP